MYPLLVKSLVRRGIRKLNGGDSNALLAMAATGVVLRFPGDNALARMFRPVVKGRRPHDTHQGLVECRAFAEEFVDRHVQFVIEDLLVAGPPWRTRVALRAHVYALAPDGNSDDYNNRAVAFLELRWGRLTVWEDYEDTQRSAEWDRERDRERVGARVDSQAPPGRSDDSSRRATEVLDGPSPRWSASGGRSVATGS